MNILLIVTGSISAYKAPDIANSLRYRGHHVQVVMTEAAQKFVTPLAFRGQRFITYTDTDEWNYSVPGVLHVDLAQWAHAVLVAPATANTIAKIANGITDNLALSVVRAFNGAVYIAPAMNTQMYENTAHLRNASPRNVIITPRSAVLACGVEGIGALARTADIVDTVERPLFPLNMKVLGFTHDSMSFERINTNVEVEIPQSVHCGGFGFVRKHHVHEGVDLYTPEGSPVYSCEAGMVTHIGFFTGPEAESPWWQSTDSITIKNYSDGKYSIYGELSPVAGMAEGATVKKGQLIGHIKRVLTKDKGRPMSMLHMERYSAESQKQREIWHVGGNAPEGIENPATYLDTCFWR